MGSRVLIYSQMSSILNILEDCCLIRQYLAALHFVLTSIDTDMPDSAKVIFVLEARSQFDHCRHCRTCVNDWYGLSNWSCIFDAYVSHPVGIRMNRNQEQNSVEQHILERAAQWTSWHYIKVNCRSRKVGMTVPDLISAP
jgi:hypothetical protein